MGRVEKSIEIKASPENVWEMRAFDKQIEWDEEMQKGLKSLEYTSEVRTSKDKYRVGASGHANIKEMGAGEIDFEVTESLENEKLTHCLRKSRTKETVGIITLVLEPIKIGDITKFTCIFDNNRMPWGILGKILDKLTHGETEKAVEKWCTKLKSILEK